MDTHLTIFDAMNCYNDEEMVLWLRDQQLTIPAVNTIFGRNRVNLIWKVLPGRGKGQAMNVFIWCVQFGDISLMKWIARKYHLKSEDVWMKHFDLIELAIEGNQLAALQELDKLFGLPKEFVFRPGSDVIQMAVRYHRLSILEWLAQRLAITLSDIEPILGGLLVEATSCGYLDIVNWIFSKFELRTDMPKIGEYIFKPAAESDNLFIVKELIKKHNLDVTYLTHGSPSLWSLAIHYGRLKFLQWADQHFDLKKK